MADTKQYIDSVNVGGTHYEIADPQARAVATEKYDENVEYAEGNFCIKDDILYKFTKAKTKGPWDAGVVEPTTVPVELQALQKKITDLTEKSTITPTPITGLEFSPATFFTKAGVAYLNIQLSNRTTSPISMENGKVLASGFPIPYKKQQVYTEAIPWNNGFLGSDAKTTTLRLCINGSGQLCSYFPSKNEQISVGMPICINMAYPVEE